MLIEIRLLARLFRIPLLHVEGVVALRDDDAQHISTSSTAARPNMIDTMSASVRVQSTARHSAGTLPKPKRSSPALTDRDLRDRATTMQHSGSSPGPGRAVRRKAREQPQAEWELGDVGFPREQAFLDQFQVSRL
jgi:hypothetical protein